MTTLSISKPDPILAPPRPTPHDLRVVVVEHHDALRMVLTQALSASTAEPVRSLAGWREFTEEVQAGTTDVVVLDLDLPVGGGLPACRQARALHPQVHLIAMSAGVQSHDAAAALDAGADQLLAKPVSPVELMAHIKRLQTRRRQAAAG